MAFCSSCGAQVQGRFCPNCGKEVGAAASGYASGAAARDIPRNVVAALCYVPVVVPLVCLLVDPFRKDRDIRFHAIQSLLLSLCLFVLDEVIGFLVSGSITLSSAVARLLRVATVVLLVYLGYQAYLRRKVLLPWIGPFAEKQV